MLIKFCNIYNRHSVVVMVAFNFNVFLIYLDPLNTMYRVESEQSIGDSDENIMEHLTEGGVTILKQLDRKRQVNFVTVSSNTLA